MIKSIAYNDIIRSFAVTAIQKPVTPPPMKTPTIKNKPASTGKLFGGNKKDLNSIQNGINNVDSKLNNILGLKGKSRGSYINNLRNDTANTLKTTAKVGGAALGRNLGSLIKSSGKGLGTGLKYLGRGGAALGRGIGNLIQNRMIAKRDAMISNQLNNINPLAGLAFNVMGGSRGISNGINSIKTKANNVYNMLANEDKRNALADKLGNKYQSGANFISRIFHPNGTVTNVTENQNNGSGNK